MATIPTKTAITDYVTGEAVDATVLNRPIGELETNIDDIITYLTNQDLGDLPNLDTSAKADGFLLAWDNGGGNWVAQDPSAHTHTYVPLAGGNMTGPLTMDNDVAIQLENSSGTARDVLEMTATNVVSLGHTSHTTRIIGSSFVFNDGADRTVWHANNDGTGSGLDADLLDGIEGSGYIRATANDDVTAHTEWQDTYEARFGNDGDLAIHHTTGQNYIDATLGDIHLQKLGVDVFETTSYGTLTTGECRATTFQIESAAHLKDIHGELEVDPFNTIKLVDWDWKETSGKEGYDSGVIADEVAKVFPNLVSYDEDGSARAVDYGRLGVHLALALAKRMGV